MFVINGVLNDRQSSHQRPASLTQAELGAVMLKLDGQEFLVDAQKISISSRLGNSARYIDLGELGRFESRDNDAIDKLSDALGHSSNLTYKLESNLSLVVVAMVISVLVIWGAIKYGVPAAADAIVDAIPATTSDYLEEIISSQVEERFFSPSTLADARQAQLHALFEKVSQRLGTDSRGYRFKLRKASDELGPNALAFPSGTIIMTDQLVMLAKSDKQIAGVMAHEIGHLDGRHSLRQIVRGSLMTFIIASVTGDVTGASVAVLSAPAVLMELQYSREFETDADGYALQYFDCDIDGLRQMGQFFVALGGFDNNQQEEAYVEETTSSRNTGDSAKDKQSGITQSGSDFLSTHPASGDRQAFFENHIRENCQP